MSKLALLLALYAAGAATYLLTQRSPEPADAGGGGTQVAEQQARREIDTRDLRRLMTGAEEMIEVKLKDLRNEVDLRLARLEALRKEMQDGVDGAQRAAQDAARGAYGKVEALDEEIGRLRSLSSMGDQLAQIKQGLEAMEARVVELEKRPAQVVREVGGGSPAGPAPTPKEPKGPVLPTGETRDPEVVREEIEKAKKDVQSNDLGVLFPAIEKVREHRVLEAVPRLLQILAEFPDEFGRTAAAAALGKMQVVDAVPGLSEALVDKSGLVAQQANKSIRQITNFDTEISPTARIRERRTARNRFREWWRAHEDEVRQRLGQPK